MAKWEVSTEVTLFDTEKNRSLLEYHDKMDIMMGDKRNEPADGQHKLKELEELLEFGKRYRFTTSVEEIP
jgi:hypothetical protein